MTKNIDDMIVPERKRSIRNIPIPEGRRRNGSHPNSLPAQKKGSEGENTFDDFHIEKGGGGGRPLQPRRSRRGLWWSMAVLLVVLVFVALSFFNGALISYIPKSGQVSFANETFTAAKGTENELIYSLVKLSLDRSLEVPASGEKEISRKAEGTIIVYNTGSKSQRLRATTRFETPDGKVYQVEDAITVPGKSTVGGVEKPGSLEIVVLAETPGEEFNIGLSDFTLPGLEGTSLEKVVYARSKTAMTGGFVGVEREVSEDDRLKAETELKTILRQELLAEAGAQVPEDFILISSLSDITFENLPQSLSSSKNSTNVNMRGHLSGVMFQRVELSTTLTKEKSNLSQGELVDLTGLETLSISFATTTDLSTADEITFSVSGESKVVWETDEVALRADLLGKSKKDLTGVLSNYQSISQATATIRPFWKRSFPSDGDKISFEMIEATQ